MKKSYVSLGGIILFSCLLIGNLIFKVSPESNMLLGVFIGIFILLFFFQRKEKRT